MFHPKRLDEQLRRSTVDIHKVAEELGVNAGLIADWAKGDPRNSPVAPTDEQCGQLEVALGLPTGSLRAPSTVSVDQPQDAMAIAVLDGVMAELGATHHQATGGLPGAYTLTTDDPVGVIRTIRSQVREGLDRDPRLSITFT